MIPICLDINVWIKETHLTLLAASVEIVHTLIYKTFIYSYVEVLKSCCMLGDLNALLFPVLSMRLGCCAALELYSAGFGVILIGNGKCLICSVTLVVSIKLL